MLFNGNNKNILSWVELSWVDKVLSVDKLCLESVDTGFHWTLF